MRYEDYDFLTDVSVQRNHRYKNNTKGTSAWVGGFEEPYWTLRSREVQRSEWIDFFKNYDTDDKRNLNLARKVVKDSILATRAHHDILYLKHTTPVFSNFEDLIKRDKELYKRKWLRQTASEFRATKESFSRSFGMYKPKYYCDLIYPFLRMIKYYGKKRIRTALLFRNNTN